MLTQHYIFQNLKDLIKIFQYSIKIKENKDLKINKIIYKIKDKQIQTEKTKFGKYKIKM